MPASGTRVVVAHHNWGLGGETEFNVSVVRAFCTLGWRVLVAAVSRPHRLVEEALSAAGCVEGVTVLLPLRLSVGAVAQRLLLPGALARALRGGVGLVWVDAPTYGPVVDSVKGAGAVLVEYIHFPLEAADPRVASLLPPDLRVDVEAYFARYRRRLPWRAYMAGYLALQRLAGRGNPFKVADAVLANSGYIADIVEVLWGARPAVLPPPVDVESYSPGAGRGFGERGNEVVVLGRVSPEKRIETVVAAAAKARAKPRVVVAGAVAPAARPYLARVRRLARRLGVELAVIENPPRRLMAEAAWRARVYVHAAVGEHFGITVVEAMAAGLPVVVRRSGGPYRDIIERGRWGLHYSTIGELAEALDTLLASEREWIEYHLKSVERAKNYSPEAFRARLGRLVERLLR